MQCKLRCSWGCCGVTDPITIDLSQAIPLQNVWQRWHWRRRGNYMKQLAWSVKAELMRTGVKLASPKYPLPRVTMAVTRYNKFGPMPDPDGVIVKPLLDVLQPQSRRHPYGLGVILDDTEEVILDMNKSTARGPERTHVEIYPA